MSSPADGSLHDCTAQSPCLSFFFSKERWHVGPVDLYAFNHSLKSVVNKIQQRLKWKELAQRLCYCLNREAGVVQKTHLCAVLATHLGPDLTHCTLLLGGHLCPPRCLLFPAHLVTPPLSPLQYRVIVPLMGAMSDLCEALSRLSGIAAENVRRGGQWRSASWGRFIVLWSLFLTLSPLWGHSS